MNSISAEVRKSEFVPSPHLQFVVDGQPLDQVLASVHPDRLLNGLVPTTLNWMEDADEQAEVWRRFTDLSERPHVVPLLCCPDDLDFSCAVVVVDAQLEANTIRWNQFGFDATPFHRLPGAIGSVVDWLPGIGPFVFSREDYESVVGTFAALRVSS